MSTTRLPGGRWFHIIDSTYGAWLPGDPRGFRTWKHRKHVEGDYKSPPPKNAYARQLRHSTKALKEPPVRIPPKWRAKIGTAIVEKLVAKGAFVLCAAVSAQHTHVLAKLPPRKRARLAIGLAKKNATFEAKSAGWTGRLWAHRGKALPVRTRTHQLAVYRYILAHAKQGAWVWHWRMCRARGD
jgi:hypothetical protein